MAIRTSRRQAGTPGVDLTSEQVWQVVARASFAVLSHRTPAGEPRSSGVVYKAHGGSWPWRWRRMAGRPGISRRTAGSQ